MIKGEGGSESGSGRMQISFAVSSPHGNECLAAHTGPYPHAASYLDEQASPAKLTNPSLAADAGEFIGIL